MSIEFDAAARSIGFGDLVHWDSLAAGPKIGPCAASPSRDYLAALPPNGACRSLPIAFSKGAQVGLQERTFVGKSIFSKAFAPSAVPTAPIVNRNAVINATFNITRDPSTMSKIVVIGQLFF